MNIAASRLTRLFSLDNIYRPLQLMVRGLRRACHCALARYAESPLRTEEGGKATVAFLEDTMHQGLLQALRPRIVA